jgi:hypothetical protein
MAKIDRLGWAEGISFYAYGLRIGVRTNKPGFLDQVRAHLPPGWEPGCCPFVDHLYSLKMGGQGPRPNVRQYTLLYGGLTQLARTMVPREALEALETDLEHYVGKHARNRVFLHAGAVGWQGRALVLPGRSFAGKSTLVAALLRAGATYYSDEFTVLDGLGQVHPFARPLALRQESGARLGRQSPEDFGSHAGQGPLPVGLVAFLEFAKDKTPRLRSLSAGHTVLELMKYCLCAEQEPEMALSSLEQTVRGAVNLKGVRGQAEETVEMLLRALEAGPPIETGLAAAA